MSIWKNKAAIYIYIFGMYFDICVKAGKQDLQALCTKCRPIVYDKNNLHMSRSASKNRGFEKP